MNKIRLITALLAIAAVTTFSACDGGSGSGSGKEQGGTEPGTTDPGTTEPGTTEPGTTETGTTDPNSEVVDITPPSALDLRFLSIGAGSISFAWDKPSEEDYDHILLHISSVDVDIHETITGELNTLTTNGLTNGNMYTVSVVVVDTSGNESEKNAYSLELPDLLSICVYDLESLKKVNDELTENYILLNDIDLAGVEWDPIGSSTDTYTGNFDGNGKTISNLAITASGSNYQGLFALLGEKSQVKDLNLVNVNITGNDYVGSLAGETQRSKIINCSISGKVSGRNYTGGVIGNLSYFSWFGSTVEKCSYSGTVSGTNYIGGLTGFADSRSRITYSSVNADVSGLNYVGGLTGYLIAYTTSFCSIDYCYAAGSVDGNFYVGGAIGYHGYGTLSNSYSLCSVSGNENVGGLVGHTYAEINSSFCVGRVSGTDSQTTGGLVGAVTPPRENQLGGPYLKIENSYYNSDTSGQSDSGKGIGKTTVELKQIETFTSTTSTDLSKAWDFVNNPFDDNESNNYWAIDPEINSGYPYLLQNTP